MKNRRGALLVHSQTDIDSDIDILLRRWARWLRAGSSGLSGIGHGAAMKDEEYSDPVAEMLDQLIAQLPKQLKYAIMDIWYIRKSETQSAEERHMPRGRFKTVLSTAVGWLCGSLANRINNVPTIDNVEHWEKKR